MVEISGDFCYRRSPCFFREAKEVEKDMQEKKKFPKGLYTVLMLICIVVFLFALYKVVGIVLDYKEIDDYYDAAEEEFVEADDHGVIRYVDLAKLVAMNKDIKGWIYIKDTDISYPILQGQDNSYYLNRTYEKEWLLAGSIFMDYKNTSDYSDAHTVIYGHNMHNGAMFGTLDKFAKEEYRDQHPYVYIMKTDGNWDKFEIYSCYTADVEDGTFDFFKEGQGAYDIYVRLTTSKNYYKETAAPENGERILTLSTCTEDSDDFKRFVLQCKYLETVEKID